MDEEAFHPVSFTAQELQSTYRNTVREPLPAFVRSVHPINKNGDLVVHRRACKTFRQCSCFEKLKDVAWDSWEVCLAPKKILYFRKLTSHPYILNEEKEFVAWPTMPFPESTTLMEIIAALAVGWQTPEHVDQRHTLHNIFLQMPSYQNADIKLFYLAPGGGAGHSDQCFENKQCQCLAKPDALDWWMWYFAGTLTDGTILSGKIYMEYLPFVVKYDKPFPYEGTYSIGEGEQITILDLLPQVWKNKDIQVKPPSAEEKADETVPVEFEQPDPATANPKYKSAAWYRENNATHNANYYYHTRSRERMNGQHKFNADYQEFLKVRLQEEYGGPLQKPELATLCEKCIFPVIPPGIPADNSGENVDLPEKSLPALLLLLGDACSLPYWYSAWCGPNTFEEPMPLSLANFITVLVKTYSQCLRANVALTLERSTLLVAMYKYLQTQKTLILFYYPTLTQPLVETPDVPQTIEPAITEVVDMECLSDANSQDSAYTKEKKLASHAPHFQSPDEEAPPAYDIELNYALPDSDEFENVDLDEASKSKETLDMEICDALVTIFFYLKTNPTRLF